MPRKKKTDGKAANGMGNIRQKTVTRNGKEYPYWEGRYTVGFDPGSGKQIQRSVTGKTQKEAAQKLKAALAALDTGTYTAPCKMTVGSWMDIWDTDYLGGVKPYTVADYTANIKNHIKPALGAVKLEALNTHTIQGFYNNLVKPPEEGGKGLSPKTLRNIHSVLHRALQQAVSIGYIRSNPTDACILPRMEKPEIKPLDEKQMKAFLAAIKGHPLETFFTFTMFTGLRKGEVLGLRWDCVDFKRGTILVDKQLQREKKKGGTYVFVPLKNDKSRTITPAAWVMQLLKHHRAVQAEQRLKLGPMWEDSGLVFTTETGRHLDIHTIQRAFKPIVASIGCPKTHFHDLRHSYAVTSILSGDDIKTVQANLGHATAAFTLDVYGHVTDQMKQESARRMDSYIKNVLGQ